jgi:hypothetical protein
MWARVGLIILWWLSQIVMDWAKWVAFEQGEQHWLTTGTVLTFGSYDLGVSAILQFVHYLVRIFNDGVMLGWSTSICHI